METVVGAIADEVEVVETHRTPLLDHGIGRSAHGPDPLGQLPRVADGRRQADELHVPRQVDDDLLPHRTAIRVLEEVHLVEDHDAESVEALLASVDHVAQHLGRHHDDRRVTVDRVVAGEQPDLRLAVELDEVAVLLVRKRLDRCRVERPRATSSGELDAVLGDDRLAAAGRCGDDDVAAVVERVERLELEAVERERVPRQDLRSIGTYDHGVVYLSRRRLRLCGGDEPRTSRPGSTRSRGRTSGARGPAARSGHPTA